MTMTSVNLNIDEILRSIKKENGIGKKDDRIKTLDAISEKAQQFLSEVNNVSKDITDYIDDQDDLLEQMDKLNEEMIRMGENTDKSADSLKTINERIKELSSKKDRTDAEENELDYLLYQQKGYSDKLESNNNNCKGLQSKLSSTQLSFVTLNQDLEQVADNMDQYQVAGQKIQAAANEVGKKDKDCAKTMDRKEGNKFNNYLNEMNYQFVGDQTYFDSNSKEYVAEYDIIEGKSGSKVNGKMNQATIKVFSYGKTLNFASYDVKTKALAAKRGE